MAFERALLQSGGGTLVAQLRNRVRSLIAVDVKRVAADTIDHVALGLLAALIADDVAVDTEHLLLFDFLLLSAQRANARRHHGLWRIFGHW